MEMAERNAIASELSASDTGTKGADVSTAGLGICRCVVDCGASVAVRKVGVMGEYGGAFGDMEPSLTLTWFFAVSGILGGSKLNEHVSKIATGVKEFKL